MRQSGFSLVDGDSASGASPAVARHWALCAAFVVLAQWCLQVLFEANDQATALILRIGGFGDWNAPLAAVSWLVLPFALTACIVVWFSKRYDKRGLRALGVKERALVGALPWLLAGLVASSFTIATFFFLAPGWIQPVLEALRWLVPATLVQAGSEELLFRGALLPMLVARYGSARGIIISAALFALWHLYPGQSAVDAGMYALTTFIFGVSSAVLVLHQGHIGGAIALHLIWNLTGDVDAGLSDWSGAAGILGMFEGFWSSYTMHASQPWTLADLQDQETMRKVFFPLILETMIVFAACRITVEKIVADFGGKTPSPAPD